MVVAAIEAISNSRFGKRMTVVPTEADTQCIKAATDYNSTVGEPHVIVTNDSDLLTAATGRESHIMMLYELARTRELTQTTVQARVFHPSAIAKAVGLNSMMDAGFFMAQDRHITLEAAASAARRSSFRSSQEYSTFCHQYRGTEHSTIELSAPLAAVMRSMDPRVAELGHQLLSSFSRDQQSTVNVFLPPLLEDVEVSSAWKVGSQLRGTIYGMLLDSRSDVSKVVEHARHGHHIGRREHPSSHTWHFELTSYATWMQDVFSQLEDPVFHGAQLAVRRFRYLAALMVVDFHASEGKALSRQQILQLWTRGTPGDWSQLQIDAMLQAALYSLRMAKQLLAFKAARDSLRPETMALEQVLRDMPGIASLLDRQDDGTDNSWMPLARELKERADAAVHESQDEDPDSDIEDENMDDDERDHAELVNNPFAMLSR